MVKTLVFGTAEWQHMLFTSYLNQRVRKVLENEVSIILELISPKTKHCKTAVKKYLLET